MLFDSADIVESVFLGVALATTGKSIVLYSSMIGATTFGCCLAVLVLGKKLGERLASMLRRRAARCWFASVLKRCSSNFCKGIVAAWMRHLACVPSFIFGVEDSVDFRQKAVLLWHCALR